jgi:hypothetical protein
MFYACKQKHTNEHQPKKMDFYTCGETVKRAEDTGANRPSSNASDVCFTQDWQPTSGGEVKGGAIGRKTFLTAIVWLDC